MKSTRTTRLAGILLMIVSLSGCYTVAGGQGAVQPVAETKNERPAQANKSPENRLALSLGVGAGGAQFENETSGFAGLSGGFEFERGLFLLTSDLNLNMVNTGETEPYYQDDSVDRCRDSRNGQFASDENCIAMEMYFGVSGDANIALPNAPVFGGMGFRAGTQTNPYVSLGWTPYEQNGYALQLKGRAWADYFFGGAFLTFGL